MSSGDASSSTATAPATGGRADDASATTTAPAPSGTASWRKLRMLHNVSRSLRASRNPGDVDVGESGESVGADVGESGESVGADAEKKET